MEDPFGAVQRRREIICLEVKLQKFDRRAVGSQPLAPPCGEIVHDPDTPPRLEESRDKVRANEPRAASDNVQTAHPNWGRRRRASE